MLDLIASEVDLLKKIGLFYSYSLFAPRHLHMPLKYSRPCHTPPLLPYKIGDYHLQITDELVPVHSCKEKSHEYLHSFLHV